MLTHDDLKTLAAVTGPCLTIFHPLRNDSFRAIRSQAGLTTAIQEAEEQLTVKGFDGAERDDMLRPVRKISLNTDWADKTGSLVVFRAPDCTLVDFWPEILPPRVRLAEDFLLLPLLPGIVTKREFWLLALSMKAVRLYRGSGKGLIEVPLPKDTPHNLGRFEAFDQPDHSLRGRSSAGPSVGSMKGVQFGTSTSHESEPDHLHDFFRAVDRGIDATLSQDPQPLILAAVPRELAIYRKVNSYSPVLAGAIHGNPDALGSGFLYEKATQLMTAFSSMAAEKALRQIEEAANHGLLISDPAAIIEAAGAGRVDDLIVFPAAEEFCRHEDSINWAALATIRNSGTVSFANAAQTSSGVAAILRFRQYPQGNEIADETSQSAG